MDKTTFEWDPLKNEANFEKHQVTFFEAQHAFLDPARVVAEDVDHSVVEKRYYCFGKVQNGEVVTVRFTYRKNCIRILGAGYWRKGKKIYEKENKIHR